MSDDLSSDPNELSQDWSCVYDANSGVGSLSGIILSTVWALWTSRTLAWRLFLRNFASNYRQSVLGWLWIFLPPLANAGIWVLLNSSGTVKISSLGGLGYAAFVFTGTMLWQAFVDGLLSPMNTMQANRSTLTKLQFPKEVLVTVGILEVGFDLVARSLIALLLLLIAGSLNLGGLGAMLLIWAPILIILGVGMGLWVAPFGLLYKDVSKTLIMVTPLWMLLTPVIYPMPAQEAGTWMAWVNPPAAIISTARGGLLSVETKIQSIVNTENNEASSATIQDKASQANTKPIDSSTKTPPSSAIEPQFFLQAFLWAVVGCALFLSGLVWLRISSPIVIERLAN